MEITSNVTSSAGGDSSNPPVHSDDDTALVEQAKGVLIFRYGIDADAAHALMELWAAETGSTISAVAHAVVHEICQGERRGPTEPPLVRWLEERLRQEFPGVDLSTNDTPTHVTVAVGHSEGSLDAVSEAARRADRLGVPLELTAHLSSTGGESPEHERAHLMQRMDLALELARSLAPGLEIRLAPDNPLESDPQQG